MKRYLLFGGDLYYPDGGWRDFVAGFDSPAEAGAAARDWAKGKAHSVWYQVVDGGTGEVLDEYLSPARE